MIELSVREIQAISGGSAYYDVGYVLGGWYGDAVDYMSETVFPFYLG